MFNSTPKPATTFTLTTSTPTAPTFGLGPAGGGDDKTQQNKPPLFGTNLASSTPFGFSPTSISVGLISGAPTSTATITTQLPAFGASVTKGAPPQFSFGTSTAQTSSFTPVVSSISNQGSLGGILNSAMSSTSTSSTASTIVPKSSTSGIVLPSSSTQSTVGAKLTFSLPQTTSAPSLLTSAASTTAPSSTTATITPSTTSTVSSNVTYNQLEDQINKWTIDLEEQGKHFINQAKQLNAWDSLLIQNGDKIRVLNSSIERVKQEQQQLDHGLDFVIAQQKELEELIIPLEKELANIPQSTDQERNRIYQLAESMDSQMKQMSEDLKGIIEHLNESNKEEDINDPVNQISRILNAHMNSLQWIDRNTAQISSYLEQISKMQDMNRRNNAIDL